MTNYFHRFFITTTPLDIGGPNSVIYKTRLLVWAQGDEFYSCRYPSAKSSTFSAGGES